MLVAHGGLHPQTKNKENQPYTVAPLPIIASPGAIHGSSVKRARNPEAPSIEERNFGAET